MSAFDRINDLLREFQAMPLDNSPDKTEAEDIGRCPVCGQIFDRRELASLLYHDRPRHSPVKRP